MSSLYRRQVLVLDLSKTGSCFGCIKDGVRSCQVPIIFSNFSTVFTQFAKTVVLTCFLKAILCQ